MAIPYFYQLQNATFAKLSALDFKTAVVDMDDTKMTLANVNALNASGKQVFAYVSIGEAEPWRDYWLPAWNSTAPSWTAGKNPVWGGYYAKFWDPAWQNIVFARIDKAISLGYDGIYMDVVDIYQISNVANAYHGPGNVRTAMMNFVIAISAYAKAIDPNFQIVANNGLGLLSTSDSNPASPNAAYLAAIDGVGVESLWYNGNTVSNWTQNDLKYLAHAVNAHKYVLAMSYPTQDAKQETFVSNAIAAGFVPFVPDQLLTGVIDSVNLGIEAKLAGKNITTPWANFHPLPPNDAPIGGSDGYGADQDTPLVADVSQGVLANDSDANNDALKAFVVAGPGHGSLTLNADGSFTYTPVAGYFGADAFTYKVNDGKADSAPVTVTLTVAQTPPPPLTVVEAGALWPGFASTPGEFVASAPEGATSTVEVSVSTADGAVYGVLAGDFAGAFAPGQTIPWQFVLDNASADAQALGEGESRAVTVQFTETYFDADGNVIGTSVSSTDVTVRGANDAPALNAALADQNSAFGAALVFGYQTGAFSDVDHDDTLTYTATLANGAALPSWLVFDAATQSFSGAASAAGTIQVRVTVTDTHGVAATDDFSLTVAPPPPPPPPPDPRAGDDALTGTSRADTLDGRGGNDTIKGQGGADVLDGGDGEDNLDGGAGKDTLKGGAGSDILYGGADADILTGGAGADKFVFKATGDSGTSTSERDVITDWGAGDVIDLSGIDANTSSNGNQAFTFLTAVNASFTGAAQVHYRYQVINGVEYTIVEGNVNSNKSADFAIALLGHQVLTAENFVL